MPMLGDLAVLEVVQVDKLAVEGAAVLGERGVVDNHGVIVIGQEMVDGDAAHLNAGLLEDPTEQCQIMPSSSSAAKAATSPCSDAA